MMTRLLLVALSILFLWTAVFAQQGNTNIKLPTWGKEANSPHHFQPDQVLLRSLRIVPDRTLLSRPFTIAEVQVKEPEFKFINGAIYISLLSGVDQAIYLPLPGGGASGCLRFGPRLADRPAESLWPMAAGVPSQ